MTKKKILLIKTFSNLCLRLLNFTVVCITSEKVLIIFRGSCSPVPKSLESPRASAGSSSCPALPASSCLPYLPRPSHTSLSLPQTHGTSTPLPPFANAILSRILFPARRPELVSKCYPKCHPPKRSPPILQITLRSPVCNLSDIYFYFNAV